MVIYCLSPADGADGSMADDSAARHLAEMYAKKHPTMHLGTPKCAENEGEKIIITLSKM